MKAAVRYYSRGGNTEKLANAIAQAIGVTAYTTAQPLDEDVDVLFLGSSVYAYGVDESVKAFIAGIHVKVGKVVNFSTAAVIRSTYKQVEKLLGEKGILLAREDFACRGSFGPLHRGHPDQKDLEAAAAFAKSIVNVEKQ